MPRTRASAKAAGTRFETMIAGCLARHVDDRIERRTKSGRKDRGDIAGLRHMGGRVVLELKDYGGRFLLGPWLNEVEIERGNDDALAGAVVIKRRATTEPLDQVVVMTMRDLISLLTGERP
jgi:hypothetical protein